MVKLVTPEKTVKYKFWVELIAPDGSGVNQIGYELPNEEEFDKIVKQFKNGNMVMRYTNKEGQHSMINIDNPYVLHAYTERISTILQTPDGAVGNMRI